MRWNEGASTATTLTLSDDGSNTMLFATAESDALSTDWANLKTIDLTKTSGFVTLTGLETDAACLGPDILNSTDTGDGSGDTGTSSDEQLWTTTSNDNDGDDDDEGQGFLGSLFGKPPISLPSPTASRRSSAAAC